MDDDISLNQNQMLLDGYLNSETYNRKWEAYQKKWSALKQWIKCIFEVPLTGQEVKEVLNENYRELTELTTAPDPKLKLTARRPDATGRYEQEIRSNGEQHDGEHPSQRS